MESNQSNPTRDAADCVPVEAQLTKAEASWFYASNVPTVEPTPEPPDETTLKELADYAAAKAYRAGHAARAQPQAGALTDAQLRQAALNVESLTLNEHGLEYYRKLADAFSALTAAHYETRIVALERKVTALLNEPPKSLEEASFKEQLRTELLRVAFKDNEQLRGQRDAANKRIEALTPYVEMYNDVCAERADLRRERDALLDKGLQVAKRLEKVTKERDAADALLREGVGSQECRYDSKYQPDVCQAHLSKRPCLRERTVAHLTVALDKDSKVG